MGNLPKEQRAAVKQGDGHDATAPVKNVPVEQEPGPGQILVKINWTGLCASDKSLLHDEWAGFGVKMSMFALLPSKVFADCLSLQPMQPKALQAMRVPVSSQRSTLTSRTSGRSETGPE